MKCNIQFIIFLCNLTQLKKIIHHFILLFLFIIPLSAIAKEEKADTISITQLKKGISLNNTWKYKTGDDISWMPTNYDDSAWQGLSSVKDGSDSLLENFDGVFWYRASLYIDSSVSGIPIAMQLRTNGACDVYIDGKFIKTLGVVGETITEQVSGFSVRPNIIPFPSSYHGWHYIAVRVSSFGSTGKLGIIKYNSDLTIAGFEAKLVSMNQALEEQQNIQSLTIPLFFSAVFIVLSIFHLILFLYYRKNRLNLYYSLFTLLLFLIFFGIYSSFAGADLQATKKILIIEFLALFLVPIFFIGILYEVFYKKLLKMFWILSGILTVSLLFMFILGNNDIGVLLLFLFLMAGFVETIRVFIRAWKMKRDGIKIFIFGLLFPIIGIIILGIINWMLRKIGFGQVADIISEHKTKFFLYSMLMSVSFSMTIYLARDFARMNKKLHAQILEIKQLFNRTIEQEQERKKILENQNVELEKMVTQRTEEVVQQKAVIELKNRDILDNLLYARRIQEAILPEIKLIYKTLNESFIIYLPKDIVSGDFYSFSQKDGKVIIAAADCTGHGVTGAFMSMIGSSILNQIINQRGITQPSHILNNLNTEITEALKQNDSDNNDGMDIALCTFDLKALHMQYAGANRPLWIFRNGVLSEIKPDKLAIGGFRLFLDAKFTNHELKLEEGDTIYLFSDGFADQFGGPKGKKLLSKKLREILASIQNLSMQEQEKHLVKTFNEWKGNEIQVDDVLVIGIRI